MAAAFTIPSIFTAVDKFTRPVNKMGAATQRFAAKAQVAVSRSERAFRRLMAPLRGINKLLGGFGLLVGGALIVGAITNTINIIKDFEQANANLSSIMATATGPQLKSLSDDAIRLGATTARSAIEVVGLQEAFARLGFETPQILNMTEATISGSIAMNAELGQTAELVGAMVRTFNDFSSLDTPKIIDQMTTATQKSALNFEKLQTSLPIVSGAANAAGIPFTKLLALLGKLSDAGIDASSSSTALRNIFIESAAQGLNYDQILQKIVKDQDKLTAANDEFGKRAAVSASILANNIAQTAELDKTIQGAAGSAKIAADKQLKTLNGALTILSSSYEGFILSLENGTGPFAKTLTTIVQVTSQMLSLASGSAVATSELDDQQKKIRSMAETGLFWLKVLGSVIAAIVAFKIAIVATKIALVVYNIALGVMGALSGTASIAIGGNAIALGAYKVAAFIAAGATKLFSAAQFILNIALNANPIGLVVIAIAALVGIVALVINKYDEWGAALTLILGPLGIIINLVQAFRRNWEAISNAFTSQGIIAGLKAIGLTILDALLFPLEQVLGLMTAIPGVGKLAENALKGVALGRKIIEFKLNENNVDKFANETAGAVTNTGENESQVPLVNPESAKQESFKESILEQRQNVSIDINDNTNGRASVESDNDFVPVKLTSTFAFGG